MGEYTMKKFLNLFLCLCLSVCMVMTTVAAIEKVSEDYAGLFSDDLANLFAGESLDTPESTVTSKELLSVAARLHSALNDGSLASVRFVGKL